MFPINRNKGKLGSVRKKSFKDLKNGRQAVDGP